MMPVDSFKKRYFYKAFANAILAVVSVVIQSIIPRGLGAAQYGNLNYLTDFFIQFLSTLNAGSSTGFYTKISKRPQEPKLIVFYFWFIVLAVLIAGCFIFVVSWGSWNNSLWPQIPLKYVYAALVFAGLTWIFSSLNDVTDAYGLTVPAEISKVWQRVLGLGVISFLFWAKWIDMGSMFCFQYVVLLIGVLFLLQVIGQKNYGNWQWHLSSKDIHDYCKEMYQYSKPLFVYALVSVIFTIFDRWFLQISSGSVVQGFYSLSFKVGALCFILTGAMTQLITREFSLAHHQKNLLLMAKIFRRYIPLMYAITASISCFMAVNAGKLAIILGGKEFSSVEAVVPIAIMSFYPVHQTYGQLSGVVFFATDQTSLYAKVTTVFMILGVPVTYIMLASPQHYGLGWGATGLALKVVLLAVLLNNVLLYFNARFLKLRFNWYVFHQLLSFLTFLLLAGVVTFVVDCYVLKGCSVIIQFLFSGACYCLFSAAMVYFFPVILGLSRQDIFNGVNLILKKGLKT